MGIREKSASALENARKEVVDRIQGRLQRMGLIYQENLMDLMRNKFNIGTLSSIKIIKYCDPEEKISWATLWFEIDNLTFYAELVTRGYSGFSDINIVLYKCNLCNKKIKESFDDLARLGKILELHRIKCRKSLKIKNFLSALFSPKLLTNLEK